MEGDPTVTQLTEVQAITRGPVRDTILLDKYRVETTLGFGGMGLVIKARHLALDEYVAIKVLRDDITIDEENVARFVREAKAVVKLKSEHVARIRDVGTFDDGKPYMVMELLEGIDLGRMLHDQERLEPQLAVDLVLQACDAIAEAHSIGVVHRDIKPTNLFVARRRDGSPLLKVLDFGISKAPVGMDLSLTQTASMLGTPAYMSPEQMRSARTVDARSDIWALGTVLYELVEGHVPFEAGNFAELCVMVSTEPPTPMRVAPELEEIVRNCLAKNVDDRFPTVAELAAALQPFATYPERAKREVTKISRMLSRDRTDASSPRLVTLSGIHSGTQSALSATLVRTLSFQARSRLMLVVLGALLFVAAGVGAGLWYTHEDATPIELGVTPDPAASTMSSLPEPANHVEGRVADRGVVAHAPPPPLIDPPVRTAPIRRPPPRHPPARPAAPPHRPATTPPPPPQCDPFDARNKC